VDPSTINELRDLSPKPSTKISQRIQELMSSFVTLHEYFLSKSIEKVDISKLHLSHSFLMENNEHKQAIKLDEYEKGNLTSSCVEDTFYILKSCVTRVLSTSSVFAICIVFESFSQILDAEFIGTFQKKLSIAFSSNEVKESRTSVMVQFVFFSFKMYSSFFFT
jgi:conserved oligomeric Golgi complex subunit 4